MWLLQTLFFLKQILINARFYYSPPTIRNLQIDAASRIKCSREWHGICLKIAMKKIVLPFILSSILLSFSACDNNDNSSPTPTEPMLSAKMEDVYIVAYTVDNIEAEISNHGCPVEVFPNKKNCERCGNSIFNSSSAKQGMQLRITIS
jgi:hypothetical protein